MEYTKTPLGIMIPKSNEFDLMQTLDCDNPSVGNHVMKNPIELAALHLDDI